MWYRGPLNNTGWNCVSVLICRFFFQWICIALVYNPQWVESVDTEPPHIQRADYKLYPDFWLCGGLMPLNPAFVQGLTVYLFLFVSRYFISLLLWFLHHTTFRHLFLKTFISRWCNTDADNHVTPADAWLGGGCSGGRSGFLWCKYLTDGSEGGWATDMNSYWSAEHQNYIIRGFLSFTKWELWSLR